MKNNAKENRPFVYIRSTGKKILVSKEVCDAYYDESAQIRADEQHYGRCICPSEKTYVCDGDCFDCKYHRVGETKSLSALTNGEDDALANMMFSAGSAMESAVEDRDLLERIIARFRELDPDADAIIAIWQEDGKASERSVAERIGRSPKLFSKQMKQYREEFCRIRGF